MNTKVQSTRPAYFYSKKYEAFVRSVRELLGRDDLGEANFRGMCKDPNWFSCWNDGLTPEQAVTEFRKAMN